MCLCVCVCKNIWQKGTLAHPQKKKAQSGWVCLPMQEPQVQPLGQEDSLEEGIATHSSIPAYRISWTEQPGTLQSIRSQRVGHEWIDLARTKTHIVYVSLRLEGLVYLFIFGRTSILIHIWKGSYIYSYLEGPVHLLIFSCHLLRAWGVKYKDVWKRGLFGKASWYNRRK